MEQLHFVWGLVLQDCQATAGASQNCVSIVAAVHDLYPEEKAFWVMFSTEIQVVLYSVKVVLLSLFKYFLEMF